LLEEFDTAQAVFGTNEASLSLWSLVERGPPPSVAIIKPRDVMWIKGVRDERPTFDVTFEHAGARQQLPVVDKSWLARFVDAEVGQYPPSNQEDTFLVIFSEPMGDEYWKLVATVLQLPPDDSAREH
jgi:hypothetical protein